MDELLSMPSPNSSAEYEVAMDQLLAEMRRLNLQMKCDRAEVDRIRTETQEIKIETRAVLASIGSKL